MDVCHPVRPLIIRGTAQRYDTPCTARYDNNVCVRPLPPKYQPPYHYVPPHTPDQMTRRDSRDRLGPLIVVRMKSILVRHISTSLYTWDRSNHSCSIGPPVVSEAFARVARNDVTVLQWLVTVSHPYTTNPIHSHETPSATYRFRSVDAFRRVDYSGTVTSFGFRYRVGRCSPLLMTNGPVLGRLRAGVELVLDRELVCMIRVIAE